MKHFKYDIAFEETIYSQLKISKPTTKEVDVAIVPQQPNITGSFPKAKHTYTMIESGELTDSVTRFIVKDSMPINTVKKSGFTDMIKKFHSRYDLPLNKRLSNS